MCTGEPLDSVGSGVVSLAQVCQCAIADGLAMWHMFSSISFWMVSLWECLHVKKSAIGTQKGRGGYSCPLHDTMLGMCVNVVCQPDPEESSKVVRGEGRVQEDAKGQCDRRLGEFDGLVGSSHVKK